MVMEHTFKGLFGCITVQSTPESPKQREFVRTIWLGLALITTLVALTPGLVWAADGEKTEGAEKAEGVEKAEETKDTEETEEIKTLGMQNLPNGLMLRAGWYYLFGSLYFFDI